jgi:transmembrane sensor
MENITRATEIIRNTVAVSWHAGHVELALIELDRRRRRRRQTLVGASVGTGAVALALALAGGRTPAPATPTATRGSPPSPLPVSVPVSVPVPVPDPPRLIVHDHASAPAVAPANAPSHAAAPTGRLLQERIIPRRQVAAERWVSLAGDRRFGEAYGLLRQVPLRQLAGPDELLLAADVARLAGHPEKAVPFLKRVVDEHPREFCAQLAAFSLGKIELDSLGQPEVAARDFAQARGLAPHGGLAQDALAREVEAWARAGARDRARTRAQEYVRLYPDGRRLGAVKELGGI